MVTVVFVLGLEHHCAHLASNKKKQDPGLMLSALHIIMCLSAHVDVRDSSLSPPFTASSP